MWLGVAETAADIVVFCDADVSSFHAGYVTRLVDTLTSRPGTAMAKGSYRRGGTGGRVNALVARPALDLLHPHLGHISQPLGGEYAAWRAALEQVPFVCGYGVDVGLLIDLAACFGADAVAEADLGWRHHRNRPLDQLRPQAQEVLEVILHRADRLAGRPEECPPLSSLPQLWARSPSPGDGEAAQTRAAQG
ncbi:MAG: glucosyl-3-phosphoglycerate synthase, partial [Actinomycetota bacterium]|nr:glucosyl-3-phosphoglycerate synthase [Actinomycetota bacterium]